MIYRLRTLDRCAIIWRARRLWIKKKTASGFFIFLYLLLRCTKRGIFSQTLAFASPLATDYWRPDRRHRWPAGPSGPGAPFHTRRPTPVAASGYFRRRRCDVTPRETRFRVEPAEWWYARGRRLISPPPRTPVAHTRTPPLVHRYHHRRSGRTRVYSHIHAVAAAAAANRRKISTEKKKRVYTSAAITILQLRCYKTRWSRIRVK